MMTVNEGTKKAQNIIGTHKYLYGAKGQLYTKELVNSLAKSYPNKYTATLKKEAMKDADKGYLAGDCSYLVCAAMGLPMINSAGLKNKAVMKLRPQKSVAQEGMCLWKEGHVAYIGDDLKVYEMRSTAADGRVSSFDSRAKDFEYMFVVRESPLYVYNMQHTLCGTYYGKYEGKSYSIVESLLAVGEKDISFAHRKKIAEKNNITNYLGTPAQNIQLVNLLKEGKLLRA